MLIMVLQCTVNYLTDHGVSALEGSYHQGLQTRVLTEYVDAVFDGRLLERRSGRGCAVISMCATLPFIAASNSACRRNLQHPIASIGTDTRQLQRQARRAVSSR